MGKASTKLTRQNNGGRANFAGNAFETLFAIWRVLFAVERLRGGEPSRLALQLTNCHVDDWVEDLKGERRYFQLKRKKALSWAAVGKAFSAQLSVPLKRKTTKVILVVSKKRQSRALRKSKKAIAGAEVLFFPSSLHPQKLISHEPVRSTLRLACVGSSHTASDLEAIWSSIDFAWQNVRKPGSFVHIREVLKALPDRDLPLKHPWRPSSRWLRAAKLLRRVPGFTFALLDGRFTYTDGTGTEGRKSCRTSDFREFVHRVLSQRPKELAEVQDIL